MAGIMAAELNEPPMQSTRKWIATLQQALVRVAGVRIERRVGFKTLALTLLCSPELGRVVFESH